MIKSIRFKNFFSFRDCKVELNNLNALIGINGSGKSNFIKAIKLLKATITEGNLANLFLNEWGGFDAVYFAGNHTANDKKIEIEYEFDETVLKKYGYHFIEPVYYYISLKKVGSSQNFSINECFHTNNEEGKRAYVYLLMKNGQGTAREGLSKQQVSVKYELTSTTETLLSQLIDKDRYFQIYTLREAIKDIAIYGYLDTTVQSPIRKPMWPSGTSVRLSHDGGNLPQILNRIKINSKSNYNFLITSLQAINPHYNGIDFFPIGGNIELMLDEKGLEREIHVTHISDGTLRFLCMLAIAYNTDRGKLICIDEPEIGLHPDMISEFVESLNRVSDETQFIIATHSDHILNNLSVDSVLVCEKDETNATIINTFRDKDYLEWAAQYSTGKLWRDGDLGGNRY